MNLFQATLLGILQGLTEFLPVSSSGHLVAAESFLGVTRAKSTIFEVNLHIGTLFALIVIYRNEVLALLKYFLEITTLKRPKPLQFGPDAPHPRLLPLLIIAMIPTIIIALAFEKPLTALFDKPQITGLMLILTGIILLLSRLASERYKNFALMPLWTALLIGTMQGIAIIPGISRSGSTIAIALLLGLQRKTAADFSFILSIPAIFGAALWSLKDLGDISAIGAAPLLAGLLASFASGLLAILLVLRIVRRGHLWYFAPYCIFIGIIIAKFASQS